MRLILIMINPETVSSRINILINCNLISNNMDISLDSSFLQMKSIFNQKSKGEAQLTDLLLLLKKYRCGPLRMKYRFFQELNLSPLLRIHPVWSGSPIWSMIFHPCLMMPETSFAVSGAFVLAPVVGILGFEFEDVRFRRVLLFSFSFSFSSYIPPKSLGLF